VGPNVTYVDHKSIDRLVPYQFAGSESPEEHNKSSRCLCNVQRLFRVFKFSRFRLRPQSFERSQISLEFRSGSCMSLSTPSNYDHDPPL